MATIYFAGGEDEAFYQVGGGLSSGNTFYFRSTYARGMLFSQASSACYWQNWQAFNVSTFWTSARLGATSWAASGFRVVGWTDSAFVERLQIVGVGTNTWKAQKIDGSGTVTQLGSNFTCVCSNLSGAPDKLDIFMVYAAAGTFTVYLNGVQVFTYSGDITTNSATALANIRLGSVTNGANVGWSEIILADTDTRSWSLQTLAPVANGNTHNFDIGSPAASNVNEFVLNDATIDGATTAGLIDQYTIPAIAGGTYTITAIVVSARLQKGATGPTKMDLGVRSGGVDYWSSDISLTTAWVGYQNVWNTDPNTTATWASLPINIGLKSVT